MENNQKFVESFEVTDWEVETDTGWDDILAVGMTIPFQKYKIILENGMFLECADDHILFTENGEIYTKDLKSGDYIYTKKGYIKIMEIQISDEFTNMFDLTVDNNHRYFTNDILSHNTNTLSNLAVNAVKNGYNTCIISFELSEELYIKRLSSNLFNLPLEEYDSFIENKDNLINAIEELKLTNGNGLVPPGTFMIKEFPTSTASTIDIENYIRKVEEKMNIKFKLVIVDYINIMKNWRNPNSENTYLKIKQIAEDLRAMAIRMETTVLTVTQLNRCLDLDTKVITPTGEICIKDIQVGDCILGSNGFVDVTNVFDIEEQDVYEIELEDGKTIICSARHIFPTENGDKMLNELKIGDYLFTNFTNRSPIIKIHSIGQRPTIDITVDSEDHYFYANDILTHNSGSTTSSIQLSDVSESMGLSATVDALIAICNRDEIDIKNNEVKWKALALRNAPMDDVTSSHTFNLDMRNLKITELEERQFTGIPDFNL